MSFKEMVETATLIYTDCPTNTPNAQPPEHPTMKASDELKQFLQAWLDWAEAGGVGEEFVPRSGLCHMLQTKWDMLLTDELDLLFNDKSYPFGEDEFDRRMANNTQHLDPNRLAWVRAALNDTLDTWELQK